MKQIKSYFADLHNHTTASDGALTPEELVFLAKKSGLKAVGITDHDTIEGLNEGLTAGQEVDIEIITGAEITLRFKESFFIGSLHLLVYFDSALLQNQKFVAEMKDVLSKGRGPALVADRITAINEQFSPEGETPVLPRKLREKDVYLHGERISRRHFALALNDMGLKDRSSVSEIIGNESPAYIPSGLPLDALKDLLMNWPMAKILAHPAAGSFPYDSLYREVLPPLETVIRLLPAIKKLGLDGFEVEYPGHTEELKEELRRVMLKENLTIETGGSDCHDLKSRPIGVSGVSAKDLEKLRSCYAIS